MKPFRTASEQYFCSNDDESRYPLPSNEELRLTALRSLAILDTESDERFDRIVRLAARHFRVPLVRITFVDADRVWYKAGLSLTNQQSPRSIAICAHAIMQQQVMVVPDLAVDPRFASGPQVNGPMKLRFYAGAPITLRDGIRVGSLCVMDRAPRPEFNQEDADFLADLAQVVVDELELHRQVCAGSEALQKADQEKAVAAQAKERFMNIVSHELHTPLNAIMGFGEMLANQVHGPLGDPRYVEHARHLCTASHRLRALVGRVLTYTSAEAADLRLSESAFDIIALAKDCAEAVAAESQCKDIEISVAADPSTPKQFFADFVQIREILMQVLHNAVSFSSADSTVAVRLDQSNDGGLEIFVADNGQGIDPNQIDRVISAFRQGDEGWNRNHGGIGLGLPISKMLTELHGGSLRIASGADVGTRIELCFPAYRSR